MPFKTSQTVRSKDRQRKRESLPLRGQCSSVDINGIVYALGTKIQEACRWMWQSSETRHGRLHDSTCCNLPDAERAQTWRLFLSVIRRELGEWRMKPSRNSLPRFQ